MKTKFYYIRDKQNRPVITVCLIKDKDKVYRGVAVCSVKDNPSKIIGKELAFMRAVAAQEDGTDSPVRDMPILFKFENYELMSLLIENYIVNLQDSGPMLTERERRILANV